MHIAAPPLAIAHSRPRFDQAISLARRRKHLTQEDLAERIGAPAQTVLHDGYGPPRPRHSSSRQDFGDSLETGKELAKSWLYQGRLS